MPDVWQFDPAAIKRERERRELSPRAFGRGCEPPLSSVQVTDIEAGRNLTVETLLRICNAYGLSPVRMFAKRRGRAGAS